MVLDVLADSTHVYIWFFVKCICRRIFSNFANIILEVFHAVVARELNLSMVQIVCCRLCIISRLIHWKIVRIVRNDAGKISNFHAGNLTIWYFRLDITLITLRHILVFNNTKRLRWRL